MVLVVATIETEPGRRADVLQQFARIVPQVRHEAGCQAYTPTIDLEADIDGQVDARDNRITVLEQWESVEALKEHLKAPHMTQFRSAVKEWVRSVSLQILEPGV